ncbi:hypothetical protein [Hydrogenophaga sp. OTU3427]|uniref:hypothetical protein n=1 Tax=Hydrogenophaga sp. OTU3427 TaxID=3043856 RepID=UPI00313F26D1
MKPLLLALITFIALTCNASPLLSGQNEVRSEQLPHIVVRIKVGPVAQADCDGWRWGAENACPSLNLVAIEVLERDDPIFVPRSAFSDLGSPYFASLHKLRVGFELLLKGGDASTSYLAIYRFSHRQIKSRKVTSGEFPGTAWEHTDYSFPK